MAESFNGVLKNELVYRTAYATRTIAERDIAGPVRSLFRAHADADSRRIKQRPDSRPRSSGPLNNLALVTYPWVAELRK